MFLIIAHHSVIHGGAIEFAHGPNKILALLLLPGGKLCFNTFIVLSSWFLVDKSFNARRFVTTWFTVLFYSILFTCISLLFTGLTSKRVLISALFPIAGNSHGFAATYLGFYLLLPFLKMIARQISKRQLYYLLFLLVYLVVFVPIAGDFFQYKPNLFSNELLLFILIYFSCLGFKKYPLSLSFKQHFLCILLVLIWLFVAAVWGLRSVYSNSKLLIFLSSLAETESSIVYILGGFVLFYIGKSFKIIYSGVINKIAHASFGVLLFHDHNFFRYILGR